MNPDNEQGRLSAESVADPPQPPDFKLEGPLAEAREHQAQRIAEVKAAHAAESVADEVGFARDLADCFVCECAYDYKDEETGAWTGEHDEECTRDGIYHAILWALPMISKKWAVWRLTDAQTDGAEDGA